MGGAPHPRMHGLTHVPGGPDPIPGLTFGVAAVAPSFADLVGEFAATHDLRGYWRLGEGASPFADTSGHAYGAADAVKVTTGTAMSMSITGALPVEDDDGAVQFNNTTGASTDYLDCPDPGGGAGGTTRRFNFNAGDPDMTVAAWVNPTASGSTFDGNAVGVWVDATVTLTGWRLGINWPGRTPFFQRKEDDGTPNVTITGATLTAATWAFLAATYDATNGAKLYVNGLLAASDATLFASIGSSNRGPVFGRSDSPTAVNAFCGGLDEVTIWGDPLTATEIGQLYTAGTVGTGSAPAGYVWTADGDGGASWQPPA